MTEQPADHVAINQRPGESYGHALAVARMTELHRQGREIAEREVAARDLAIDNSVMLPDHVQGAYLMHKGRLVCALVHDQSVCCSEHRHHLARMRFGGGESSCAICRGETSLPTSQENDND